MVDLAIHSTRVLNFSGYSYRLLIGGSNNALNKILSNVLT